MNEIVLADFIFLILIMKDQAHYYYDKLKSNSLYKP